MPVSTVAEHGYKNGSNQAPKLYLQIVNYVVYFK